MFVFELALIRCVHTTDIDWEKEKKCDGKHCSRWRSMIESVFLLPFLCTLSVFELAHRHKPSRPAIQRNDKITRSLSDGWKSFQDLWQFPVLFRSLFSTQNNMLFWNDSMRHTQLNRKKEWTRLGFLLFIFFLSNGLLRRIVILLD